MVFLFCGLFLCISGVICISECGGTFFWTNFVACLVVIQVSGVVRINTLLSVDNAHFIAFI